MLPQKWVDRNLIFYTCTSVATPVSTEGISLWLSKQGFAVQTLTFPNNQTPLGRFLKRALLEQIPLSTWTHHVLFSLHRWEFASWITNMLSRNYALIIERYVWSGTLYSWASNPATDPYHYMILDAGLPQPDLAVCIDTSFSDVLSRGGIAPSLFVDIDFQQQLRTCYSDPRIWRGINVVMHETQLNRWASRKTLIRRMQGESLLRSHPKSWVYLWYLWEQSDSCSTCCVDISPRQPMFRCFSCTRLIHFGCLMENSVSQKIPICQACASGSNQEPQEEEVFCCGTLRGSSNSSRGDSS